MKKHMNNHLTHARYKYFKLRECILSKSNEAMKFAVHIHVLHKQLRHLYTAIIIYRASAPLKARIYNDI